MDLKLTGNELEDHDIPQVARYQPPAGIFEIWIAEVLQSVS